MPQSPGAAPPRRGTRPSNRRDLILRAARDLFHQRGFDHIGVHEIADAVAIGPSALYRHFSGKQQLLSHVLEREHVLMLKALDAAGLADQETFARSMGQLAADFRGGSLLIQRESRHLPKEGRDEVRERSREIGRRFATIVRHFRPDLSDDGVELLAWALIAVVGSPSVHRLVLPREQFEAVIAGLVINVLGAPVPEGFATDRKQRSVDELRPTSRRENLLNEAVRLFAERGYANVAVEEIGARLGIAGPSVYNHVPSKLDLLRVPMIRGIGTLMMQLSEAFDGDTDPRVVLRRLLQSYVDFAVAHSDLLQLLFSEVRHLPDDLHDSFRRAQLEYLQEWGDLLVAISPGMDLVTARFTVQAAVTTVNDLVRVRHLREAAEIRDALVAVCERLLFI